MENGTTLTALNNMSFGSKPSPPDPVPVAPAPDKAAKSFSSILTAERRRKAKGFQSTVLTGTDDKLGA
jgi:hypothetical protein